MINATLGPLPGIEPVLWDSSTVLNLIELQSPVAES